MKPKVLFLTWMVLVVLSLAEYFLAESGWPYVRIVWGVLFTSFLKMLAVGFYFLELKGAHRFWQFLFVAIGVMFVMLAGGLLA